MEKKNIITFFKDKITSLIVPLCMMVVGILFIVRPESSLANLASIIGWLFIAAAVVLGIFTIRSFSYLTLIFASICLILGLIFVLNPYGVSLFIIKIVGLAILVNAVMGIINAYQIREQSEKHWATYCITDIISALVGFLLFFLAGDSARVLFIIVGAILAVMGIVNIVSAYRVYKVGRYVDGEGDVVWEQE